MLHIIKIEPNTNGSHDNQMGVGIGIPEGWAIVPEDIALPDTYPFVNIEVKEISTGEFVVTSMTAGIVPERKPKPEPEHQPTQLDIIEAQVAYTAMMTDTLLEV